MEKEYGEGQRFSTNESNRIGAPFTFNSITLSNYGMHLIRYLSNALAI